MVSSWEVVRPWRCRCGARHAEDFFYVCLKFVLSRTPTRRIGLERVVMRLHQLEYASTLINLYTHAKYQFVTVERNLIHKDENLEGQIGTIFKIRPISTNHISLCSPPLYQRPLGDGKSQFGRERHGRWFPFLHHHAQAIQRREGDLGV
jgi:hypothetical protein